VDVAYLDPPHKYYVDLRIEYEKNYDSKDQREQLLKASYVNEMETAILNNEEVLRRKSTYYLNALMIALISVLPYHVCIGFHLNTSEVQVQKVKIVHPTK